MPDNQPTNQGASLTMPAPAAPAAPGEKSQLLERIDVLDILRGLALLGMFMVHFNYYEATPIGAEPGRAAAFVERFLGLFIETRFYAIFGMLFGVGFAVQLTRADARGQPFAVRYLRRLAALAVFGFIAEGVFGFNVLLGYALWGAPLLLVRRWPVKALLVLLVLCTASRQIYSVGRMAVYSARPNGVAEARAIQRDKMLRYRAAYDTMHAREQSASWKTAVAARVEFMPVFHRQWNVLPNGSITLFLIGLIAWRLGVFTRPEQRKRLIVSLMVFGAVSSLLAEFVFPIGPVAWEPSRQWPVLSTVVAMARLNGFSLFRHEWLALTYIGAILLLVAHGRTWIQRLSPLAWAGRLALTNYMMQVILLDVVFTARGFGLKVPALLVIPAAIALFVAQVFMSRWWLARFRLGPLEWIWRSVTYWKLQPMRIAQPPTVPRLVMAEGD